VQSVTHTHTYTPAFTHTTKPSQDKKAEIARLRAAWSKHTQESIRAVETRCARELTKDLSLLKAKVASAAADADAAAAAAAVASAAAAMACASRDGVDVAVQVGTRVSE